MIVRVIRTANQQWSVRTAGGYKTWINTLLDQRWAGARADWEVAGLPVLAFVVNSDWVVHCPDCTEQVIAQPGEPFYCPECQNVMNAGKSHSVIFPTNQEEIETVLLARPLPATRNWLLGETIKQLKQENLDHGVPELWLG